MKKFTSRILIALFVFTFLLTPSVSKADSESEISARISQVQSQIQSLQTQLSYLQAQLQAIRTRPTIVLPDAVVKIPYQTTLKSSSSSNNNRAAISSGSLPPGLSLSSGTGDCSGHSCYNPTTEIKGTPTIEGSYAFKIKTGEGNSDRSNETGYTLKVQAATTTPLDLTTACPAWKFSTNIAIGANSNDVVALQRFLSAKGFYTGEITGYFGPTLKSALAAYQTAKGISPADGSFGAITRAAANADCAIVITVATSTLTLSASPSPLRSQNYRNGGIDTLSNVILSNFNLKSQTGDSKVVAINTLVSWSGTPPSTLYLYNGSTLVSSKTMATSGVVSFNNLGLVIPKQDVPTTLTIKADFPTNTTNGTYASVTVKGADYLSSNGVALTTTNAPVTNVNQYVYNAAAVFALASQPTLTATSDSSGKTMYVRAMFTMNVSALGATVNQFQQGDFGVKLIGADGQKYPAPSVAVVAIPNTSIADGATGSVTVTAAWASTTLPAAGLYVSAIDSIKWTAGSTTVTQTYGLEDFKTPNAANIVAQVPSWFANQMSNVSAAFWGLFGM